MKILFSIIVLTLSLIAAADVGAQTVTRSLALAWTDQADNEEGFHVERRIGAGVWERHTIVGANVQNYIDTVTAPAKTLITYRVAAYNSAGNSAFSNEASTVLLDVLPNAPGGLQVICEKDTLCKAATP